MRLLCCLVSVAASLIFTSDDTEVVPPSLQTKRFLRCWRVGLRPDRFPLQKLSAAPTQRITFSVSLFLEVASKQLRHKHMSFYAFPKNNVRLTTTDYERSESFAAVVAVVVLPSYCPAESNTPDRAGGLPCSVMTNPLIVHRSRRRSRRPIRERRDSVRNGCAAIMRMAEWLNGCRNETGWTFPIFRELILAKIGTDWRKRRKKGA